METLLHGCVPEQPRSALHPPEEYTGHRVARAFVLELSQVRRMIVLVSMKSSRLHQPSPIAADNSPTDPGHCGVLWILWHRSAKFLRTTASAGVWPRSYFLIAVHDTRLETFANSHCYNLFLLSQSASLKGAKTSESFNCLVSSSSMNTSTTAADAEPWSAIVTGGANGIGAACVRKLASRGINVLIADMCIDGKQLAEEVSKQYGVEAHYQHVDVRREEDIEEMIKVVVQKWGRVDYAVNAAGIMQDGVEKKDDEQKVSSEIFDLTYQVNQRGVWLCQKYEAAQMIKQSPRAVQFSPAPAKDIPGQRGAIVNVSSVSSLTGLGYAAYTATKHAIVGITRNGAYFYGPHGIRVNALSPGGTVTDLSIAAMPAEIRELLKENDPALSSSSVPLQKFAWPEEVANVASFLLSAESSHVSGTNIEVDGGYSNTRFGG
ncbi:hypothetical protein AC578_7031 [Pseudocercospora eumusae]|uniref:Uncharacterized protein n=1 Tax=Pseudocercospora eumusae TaxID=321146 RepID=A0A139HCN3_9PEZI|nr:hypothetical protein AC578_7031 [Pseudocercospora eumusae]